jgi:hypothetical protein
LATFSYDSWCCAFSVAELKGKMTGNHGLDVRAPWFPVDVPLNQTIWLKIIEIPIFAA